MPGPGGINVEPEEIQAAAAWLSNQREQMQQALTDANTKMNEVVEAAYATPGSREKFAPYWEDFKNGLDKGIGDLEQVSEFLKQVAQAFVDTDQQTSSGIG
ncbi:WXG100 family type VII secretion target [Streptomyces sp. NBC_01092]|uniref:WXG100 family type VII secretion target n=1 Tax=Streptomyces sp. NBC_01092 TaxID=2903748 RepID=UPI003869D016|nr:WXG100 family type VII secretion target [Streptomyces sp. NBC_01092]